MLKRSHKAVSTIRAVLIIAILLSSITIVTLAWNHSTLDPNHNFETNPDVEEPNNPEPEEPETPTEPEEPTEPEQPSEPEQPQEPNEPRDPFVWAQVRVGNEDYFFNYTSVNTTRPDLFQQGRFSMFDVLVHLDEQDEIELDYHFDETMNTHIIDAINGKTGYWYTTYYSGGWPENNVFRPDHYPWKPGTQLTFHLDNYPEIVAIYSEWQKEIQRLEANNGTIIIPKVTIRGNTFTKEFEDVEVTPHNLRNDVFQENVITAIDVILSLADQREITYELQWYDYIGTASIVRSYWVDAIDDDKAIGTCGFVYEAGSEKYRWGAGNHIHLPSDTRMINSPEYVEFFWICLEPAPLDNPDLPTLN